MRVLVLGAGFGGLELSTRLSEEFGDDTRGRPDRPGRGLRVRVLEARRHVRARPCPTAVLHPYRDFVKPGVRFVQTTIRSIDPTAKRVETDAGAFDGGHHGGRPRRRSRIPSATPGLVEGGHEFYTVPGAFALRDVLAGFPGGRVIVGGHVDAVQVPAGAERDGAAAARLPDGSGGFATPPRSRSSCRSACPSRPHRRPRRRCWSPSPSGGSTGTPSGW